jgi:hypothetical protein
LITLNDKNFAKLLILFISKPYHPLKPIYLLNTSGSTYVAVIYDDVWWPGLVQAVNQETNKVAIRFMCPKPTNKFMWPSKEQIEELHLSEILCVLGSIPSLVNQRGLYGFPQDEIDRVEKLMNTVLEN